MQNAAGGGASVHPDVGNDSYQSIVSDLVSLIAHVQASIKLLESAIARESPLDKPGSRRQCRRSG
jgi:hypothetical protein